MFNVAGGAGGTSISNLISPVAFSDSTNTSTTATTVTIYPTGIFTKNTIFILVIHTQGTAGSLPGINWVQGAGCEWYILADVAYNSVATPTKRLSVFIGRKDSGIGYGIPFSDDPRLLINFTAAPVSVRYNIDGIHNTSESETWFPVYATATNRVDSANTITTDLGYVPNTNNMQYTVVARAGGTTPVAGTGNTLLNNQIVAPLLASEVAINRQTNTMTWTTAAAAAAVTFDFSIPSVAEPGTYGEDGKVIVFYN
jgi:hypothetical protein